MLLGVMTLVASSAWAAAGDETVNADIDFSNAIADGIVKGTVNQIAIGTGGADSYIQDGVLRLGDHSSIVTIAESERAGSRDQIVIKFDMAWGNKNGMGSGFRLKDADGGEIASFQFARWDGSNTNANTLGINMSGLFGSAYNNAPILDRATTFTLTVDYATKTIKSNLSCPNPNAKKDFSVSLTNTNPIATFEVFAYNVGGNPERTSSFDNLTITTIEGNYDVQSAEYTVNFVDEEGTIKSETRTGDVGSDIALMAGDTQDQVIDGVKYIYVSNDAEGKTVAEDGSTVVTVTFRKAEEWSYTVNAMSGENVLKTLVTGTVSEGDAVSFKYPQYLAVDGDLYQSSKQSSNPWWGKSFTPDADNEIVTVDYTKTEESNIVFCEEGENIESLSAVTSGNTDIRASNGAGGYAAEDAVITTLVPGKYKIYSATYGNAGTTFNFTVGEETVLTISTSGNPVHTASDEFEVTEETNLIVPKAGNGGNSPKSIDYIIIQKTGDVEVTTKTIGLNPNIWDVEDATERYAAYVWKGEGTAKVEKWIDFAEVDGALAATIPDYYTGLILVRLDGATTENNWENKWNQTDDIDFTAIADGTVFTITGWGEGENAKSTYTTEEVTIDLTALKEKLAKATELAKLLDVDTAEAEALLVNPDATEGQLTDALQSVVTASITKAQELIALAKKFFAKFDNTAGEALAPFFAATEEALAGTDFDAMYNAAMALFAQGLVEGQSALTKVNEYLAKMENETVNNDLEAINTAIAANNLQDLLDALRQMKADLPGAAQTYAAQVQALIDAGKEAGKDVSAMETALSNAMTAYLKYQMKKADLVDVGFALYELIKAVEAYKTVVIESLAIVGDFLGLEATEEDANPNWNPANGWAMTQDTENPTIWTLVKEFTAEAKTYEYKATANGNWEDYVLPPGDNDSYTFETAGNYILTFTADTENHELTLVVEKVEEPVLYYLVGTMTDWVDDGVKEELILEKNEEAEEGVEEYIITLDFEANAQFKIVKPEGEDYVWYPDGNNNNYVIEEAGNYTVYFRPNGDGGSDWHYGVIYVVNNTTTGINALNANTQNAVIYNLAGQKVMKAQKGLYIVNGKKVLVK